MPLVHLKGSNSLFWANTFFWLEIKEKLCRFIICKKNNTKILNIFFFSKKGAKSVIRGGEGEYG